MPKENGVSMKDSSSYYCQCPRCRQSFFWRLFKIFAYAMIVLLFMFVGAAAGYKQARTNVSFSKDQRGVSLKIEKAAGMAMPVTGTGAGNVFFTRQVGAEPGQMGAVSFKSVDPNAKRIAGTIASIDGNKISLVDNGGMQQTVFSVGDTVIMGSSGELPFSALKAKQFIVSYVKEQGGKQAAQMIQVE